MPNFNENFNHFEDLVYGVTDQRNLYIDRFIKTLARQQTRQGVEVGQPGYKDALAENVEFWQAQLTQKSRMYINYYNAPILQTDFSQATLTVPEGADMSVRSYQGALQKHSKLAPQSAKTASMASLAKGDISKTGADKSTVSELILLEGLLAIRRACKFGLEDVVTRKKNATVHYILDGITMTDVLGKTAFKLFSGTVGVPITTSELRFLFRRWGGFRASRRIRFYRDYGECMPPWETADLPQWAGYALHLVTKGGQQGNSAASSSQPGALAMSIDAAVKRSDFASAIEAYHAATQV